MGAGVIGLLGIQTAQSYGATKIICADLDDSHLSKGMELGADLAVNVKTRDLKKVVMDATDGIGARVIVDTAGRPPEELLPALARGGRLINLAVHDREDRLNQFMMAGERLMMTAANFRYEEYPMAMELLYSGKVKAEPLITHRFPIDQAIEVFKAAEKKEESGAIKVIINP